MNEDILAENIHGTGAYKDNYDSRDFKWTDFATASPPFDWNVGFDIEKKLGLKIPVKDQGISGSCGGQAWSYLAEVLEAVSTGSFEERSAKYIYAQTHVPGGGSDGKSNAKIFIYQGVARESVLPSYPATESNLTNSFDITTAVRENAKSDMSLAYAQTGTSIDTIAQAMRDNNGVILGINGQNNGSWLTAFPKLPANVEWRHWIFSGKARIFNGVKQIGVLNSWGPSVGESGWQWLSQDYFSSGHVWSGWTHVLKPQSLTAPFLVDMAFGQSSEEIRRLQEFLKQIGYFPSAQKATGYYGSLTQSAVYHFQMNHVQLTPWENLVLAGKTVGSKTRAALNIISNN